MEKEHLSILVVDPDHSDHRFIQESLRLSNVPAQLDFVSSTREAFSKVSNSSYDLILTDHLLPQANAFQLLLELHQMNLSVPVIVLTRESEARIVREAFHRGADDFLLKEELETLSLFDVISNTIEKRRQGEEKVVQEMQLREQAERDGLTGLYNHRFFVDALEREFARARRYRRDLSLIMLDLDGFKQINDTCGHQQGDVILKQISRLLLQTVRFVDIVARYGGDEFAIILPETRLKAAVKLSERLIRDIRKHPLLFEKKMFPVSASIGVACYYPGQPAAGMLLKEADIALYEAKRTGRDCVREYPREVEENTALLLARVSNGPMH